MDKQLPFFNWSLKRTLDTESDSFIKARIRILYTILLFSLLKIFIVIGVGAAHEQWLQVTRAFVVLVFYTVSVKLLLYRPAYLKFIAHVMIILGVLIIWSNILIFAHNINIITLQFVFMVALSSFYIMGSVLGIVYSFFSIFPVMLYLFLHNNTNIALTSTPQEIASPGFEIIAILNFITIILAHYFFYESYTANIKEKETLNLQLQLSVAEANKMAASKSNFLSTISHELRTPLNSVIGMAELLLEDKPQPRQKENLEILQRSARDLLSLINNVLDFNKMDSDKQALEKIPFRLAEFMQNICSALKIKASDKKLSFILDIDDRLKNTNIISDPTRLSQVIYNLVSNAIKFTEKGSITVKLECVSEAEHRVEILFSVTDTGIGIHPDRHDAVFELFTQAESHTTRKYGGTGLGLAIVKQVLTLFNSSIQLQSTPGSGTKFFFTIPFTTIAEISKTEIATRADKTGLSHLKILVAEDNEFNRLIIEKQFETLNIYPIIVENGRQAYEAHASGNFDAIFIDLHMPELDGYATTKQIRAMADPVKANIYIIAFTASITEQEKIFDNGFDDYLYKPVELNDLSNKLERIAAHSNTSKQLQ